MKYVITFILAAIIGYFGFLHAVPGFVMGKLFDSLTERGIPQHAFTLSPRATPETQTVVRPSPDLAYSLCHYDFDKINGSLEVYAAPWTNYASISFFDANTNNFATVKSGRNEGPDENDIHTLEFDVGQKSTAIKSPTKRGVILIRRLAPTQAAWEAVSELSEQDICQEMKIHG